MATIHRTTLVHASAWNAALRNPNCATIAGRIGAAIHAAAAADAGSPPQAAPKPATTKPRLSPVPTAPGKTGPVAGVATVLLAEQNSAGAISDKPWVLYGPSDVKPRPQVRCPCLLRHASREAGTGACLQACRFHHASIPFPVSCLRSLLHQSEGAPVCPLTAPPPPGGGAQPHQGRAPAPPPAAGGEGGAASEAAGQRGERQWDKSMGLGVRKW